MRFKTERVWARDRDGAIIEEDGTRQIVRRYWWGEWREWFRREWMDMADAKRRGWCPSMIAQHVQWSLVRREQRTWPRVALAKLRAVLRERRNRRDYRARLLR
jgi:hypothetical protein